MYVTLKLIESSTFITFANTADPDQTALVMFAYGIFLCSTLKDFKNAKNENHYILLPEQVLPSLTNKNG